MSKRASIYESTMAIKRAKRIESTRREERDWEWGSIFPFPVQT